jgi:hypothetical protein
MLIEERILIALGLTIFIEIPITIFLVRFFCKEQNIKFVQLVFVSLLASLFTLPYIWFIDASFLPLMQYRIFAEIFGVIIEMVIYRQILQIRWDKAFLVSCIANVLTFFIGLLIL